MREFFKQTILNLYVYAGNRQADKMTDEELKILLDALCRMSSTIYSYIPEDKQKEIINACLISDKEYQNINVRVVSKWLDQNGKIFFKESAHGPTEHTQPPLTGEAREKAIQEFLDAIARAETNFTQATTKGNGARMKEALDNSGISKSPSAIEEYLLEEEKNKAKTP